jgi:hypothetical protein
MGAEELERGAFEALLADLIEKPQPGGSWRDCFVGEQRW